MEFICSNSCNDNIMAKHFKEKEKKHKVKRLKTKSQPKDRKAKTSKKKMGIVSIIFLLLFIVVFLYSSINLVIWLKSNIELEKNEKEIFSQVQTILDGEVNKIQIDFGKLATVNQDVKAWIYIENTNINYPILQAENNEYYLKKDINKNYSSCGSIFLDKDSKSDFSGENTIIYGHNLLNGKMFADLQKIVKGELGKNIKIQIYMPEQTVEYEVFSAYTGKASAEMKTDSSFEKILQKSEIEFEYNINNEENNEQGNTQDNIQGDTQDNVQNNIVTLITCGANSENRIVVSGIRK